MRESYFFTIIKTTQKYIYEAIIMAYIRRGVKKNLCCCCETIYHIPYIYEDQYTMGCIYGMCIRNVYTG